MERVCFGKKKKHYNEVKSYLVIYWSEVQAMGVINICKCFISQQTRYDNIMEKCESDRKLII